jgi:uncharacterized protein YkwD
MKVKIFLLISLLIFCSCSKLKDQEIYPQYTYNFSQQENAVMNATNVYRNQIGLNTLKSIQHIGYISEEHNIYMIEQDTISHDYFQQRTDNLIKTLHAGHVGEVLAYNYTSPQSVLNAWVNSPGHKNIIEGDFTNFGVSIKQDSNGRKYYTFIFVKI